MWARNVRDLAIGLIVAIVSACWLPSDPIVSTWVDNATSREYELRYTYQSQSGGLDFSYVLPANSAGEPRSLLGPQPGEWELLDRDCSLIRHLGRVVGSYRLLIRSDADVSFEPFNRSAQPRGSPMPEIGEECSLDRGARVSGV
jgi:hypothetical protein